LNPEPKAGDRGWEIGDGDQSSQLPSPNSQLPTPNSRRWVIFALFVSAHFLSYFLRSANAVISTDLTRDLALTAEQLGLMTSLFYASFALVQLPLGSGLDRFGPRWVTPGLMLMTVVGCVVFASAGSFELLALGRALIGVGMAGVLMGAIKVYGQWFPANRVATIAGFMVGISSMGSLFAATPLAWLNQGFGWRAIFLWCAPIVALSAGAIMLWVRNTPPGGEWHIASASAAGFRQIFADTRFWRIALVQFFLLGTVQAVQGLWAGPYLFDVLALSKLAAGNLLLCMGVGVVAGYFASGWLVDRYGALRVNATAVLVFALSQLVFVLPFHPPLILLGALFAVFGFTGAFNVALLAQARALFPPHMSGRAITAANMFGFGGTALIQWWMGLIIGAFAPDAQGHYPPGAYAAAFLFTFVGTVLALLWYATLARKRGEVTAVVAS
jgi:predicted MFS family arabinose efflux permease